MAEEEFEFETVADGGSLESLLGSLVSQLQTNEGLSHRAKKSLR
jgi:hypothetical protein